MRRQRRSGRKCADGLDAGRQRSGERNFMLESVTAIAPARLHLGFLDLNGGLGRRFGSIGLAIDHPVTRLSIARAPAPFVEGLEAQRAAAYLETLTQSLGLRGDPMASPFTRRSPITSDSGRERSWRSRSPAPCAFLKASRPTCRPTRSRCNAASAPASAQASSSAAASSSMAAGRKERSHRPSSRASNSPPPGAVLLVLDSRIKGLHGAQEVKSFAALGPFDAAGAAEICRLVLIKALPALAEADLEFLRRRDRTNSGDRRRLFRPRARRRCAN